MSEYSWSGMLKITKEKALELFDKNFPVYILYDDDTESLAEEKNSIIEYDGIFGVEKEEYSEWLNSQVDCNKVVGIVDYANGEHIEYTDKEEYLKCIREELEYANLTGFRYETLSEEPDLRKAVDDEVYNMFGEENPYDISFYTQHYLKHRSI